MDTGRALTGQKKTTEALTQYDPTWWKCLWMLTFILPILTYYSCWKFYNINANDYLSLFDFEN